MENVAYHKGARYPHGAWGDGGDYPRDIARDYWSLFKKEFHAFLCTKDKKYAALRKQLFTSASRSQVAITSTISAAISQHVGLEAGILVPFCALCLIAVLKIGREAFCSGKYLDITPE
jgi:hypothetical protein